MTAKPLGRWAAATIITLAVLLALGRLLAGDFTWWDDPTTLHHNWRFNPVGLDSFLFYWQHPAEDIYIPITRNVWALTAYFARVAPNSDGIALNPVFFHALNLFTHLAGAFGVYALLRRMIRNDWAAVLGAIFWAVHPEQVESVGWLSGYKDVLSGTLLIWAFERYAAWREQGGRVRYGTACVLYVLAMLAKPAAVVLPVLLAVYDLLIARRTLRQIATSLWPLLVAALPIVWIGRAAQTAHVADAPLVVRPLIALDAIAYYLCKLIAPVQLAVDYGRSPKTIWASGAIWYSWLLPAAIVAIIAGYYWKRRSKNLPADYTPAAGLLIFALAPLPVLGLVPFDFQNYSTVSDHYQYVAILGASIALAWLVARLPKGVFVTAAVLTAGYGARAAVLAPVWDDEPQLLTHVLRINPDSLIAHVNLAGDAARAGDYDLERVYLERAQQIDPMDPLVDLGLTGHYAATGDDLLCDWYAHRYIQKFYDHYGDSPRMIEFYQRIIDLFWSMHRLDDAQRFLDEGLKHYPDAYYLNVRNDQVKHMRNDPKYQAIPSTLPANLASWSAPPQ